ncbi:MAG: DUF1318 domain-containing protein [Planctomycetes bacterium]|nr:DUF1318 domain-containing protein [Planctomycetota bacterium]
MNRRTMILAAVVTLTSWLGLGVGFAGASTMDELKARFAQRYPKLMEAKNAGQVGETYQGFVEAVGDVDGATAKLIADENADRTELYALIAKEQDTTPDKVAERNALRNFSNAASGHYLKGRDGKWIKKK